MNKRILALVLAAQFAFLGGYTIAQTKTSATAKPASTAAKSASATPAKAAAPAPAMQEAKEPQKLVRVATLNTPQANIEFQRNVQIMQANRQRLIELNNQKEAATSTADKARLQDDIDKALAKLNEDNKKMYDTYRFSLNRNYTMVVEKSSIYMLVSDEEAAAIEAAQAKDKAAGK